MGDPCSKPRVSGKEGAKNVPDWAKGNRPYTDENGKEFAKRLMDSKYGEGKWSDTGPGSEFSQIKNGVIELLNEKCRKNKNIEAGISFTAC